MSEIASALRTRSSKAITSTRSKLSRDSVVGWALGGQILILFLTLLLMRSHEISPSLPWASAGPGIRDLSLFVFVGYALQTAWMRRYSQGGVGLALWCSAWCAQCAVLWLGIFAALSRGAPITSLTMNPMGMYGALEGALMGCIVFASIAGKVTANQLLLTLSAATPVWVGVRFVVLDVLGAIDTGGLFTIHLFGAVFALCVVTQVTPLRRDVRTSPARVGYDDAVSSYQSSMFAWIGAALQWVLWPGWVAASAPLLWQSVVGVNVTLAMIGSALGAFSGSRAWSLWDGKDPAVFSPRELRWGMVAGGVGCSGLLAYTPFPGVAMLYGLVSGLITTGVLHWADPHLSKNFDAWHDSGATFALHGVPSLLASVWSIFSAIYLYSKQPVGVALFQVNAGGYLSCGGSCQWLAQLLALIITVSAGALFGFGTGSLAVLVTKGPVVAFSDEVDWEVPEGFRKSRRTADVAPVPETVMSVEGGKSL